MGVSFLITQDLILATDEHRLLNTDKNKLQIANSNHQNTDKFQKQRHEIS